MPTVEVIKYGVQGYGGDVYAPGCLAGSDGKRVPVSINFNPEKRVGTAVLRATESGVVAEFDQAGAIDLNTVGLGFSIEQSSVDNGVRTITRATLREASVSYLAPPFR